MVIYNKKPQKTGFLFFFKMFFFLLGFVFIVGLDESRKKVLIFYPGYDNDPFIKEMSDVFNDGLSKNKSIKLFMDYKKTQKGYNINSNDSNPFFHELLMIKKLKPDIIVVFNEFAQYIINNNLNQTIDGCILFGGSNIVIPPQDIKSFKNITGILETPSIKAINEGLEGFFQNKKLKKPLHIAYVGDQSQQSLAYEEMIQKKENWIFAKYYGSMINKNWKEWKNNIFRASTQCDALLVAFYDQLESTDEENNYVSCEKVIQWTIKNSTIPVIGLTINSALDGVKNVFATPSRYFAIKLTKLITRILDEHILPSDLQKKIPPVDIDDLFFLYDKDYFSKHHLKVPIIYSTLHENSIKLLTN
jgi:hypothetical protein